MAQKRPGPPGVGGSSVKKRGSTASTAAPTCDDPARVRMLTSDYIRRAATLPFLESLMTHAEELLEKHGTPTQVLDALIPDKASWAVYVDSMFKDDQPVNIAWTAESVCTYRIWMSSWDELAGNSGFLENEQFLMLLRLTLVNGLETDVTIPGTELPILERPPEALHAGKWCQVPGYSVGAGQIWHVKGWKRLLAANYAVLVLRETNLINDYLTVAEPAVVHNFKFAYGTVIDTAGDYTKSVKTNRGATMKRWQVRQKPNCFNNCHQLDKMVQLMKQRGEHDAEQLTNAFLKNLTAHKISNMLGMTVGEAAATETLIMMPERTKIFLKGVAAKHSMFKGPFSHNGIASYAFRIGYQPECAEDWDMTNTERTIHNIALHTYNRWLEAPPGMRKSANNDVIVSSQKCCIAWEKYETAFREHVPEAVFRDNIAMLTSSFENGMYDDVCQAAANAQKLPVDPCDITDMRVTLARLAVDIERERLDRLHRTQRWPPPPPPRPPQMICLRCNTPQQLFFTRRTGRYNFSEFYCSECGGQYWFIDD